MADDPWAAFRKAPAAPAPAASDDPWAAFRVKAEAAPAFGDQVAAAEPPVETKAAPAMSANEAASLTTGGIIEGIPVVGPALRGGADRAAALARSLTGGKGYDDELKDIQDRGARLKAEHPYIDTTAQVAGGVLGTAPLVAAAPAAFGVSAASLPVRAGASLATNGALGAADAAVRSEGDADATLKGAGFGAAGGLLAPAAGAAVGKIAGAVASKIKPSAPVPTTPELKSAARAAYQRADDAGVQVAQPTFAAAVDDMARAAKEAGIDKTIHPQATAAVGRLEEAAGTAPTLKDIEILRRVVNGAGGPLSPDEQRIAGLLVDKLDEFTGGLKAGDLISGDAATAVDALTEARGLWSRAKKAELIEDAVTRAENRAASTGSGGNAENAIRQNIRAILDSPKKRAGFTDAEKAAMVAIVRGTPIQNALRLMGKFSPTNGALMAMLGGGASVANPAMAAVPAAGYVAKTIADRGVRRGAAQLNARVRAGGEPPASPLAIAARKAAEPAAISVFSSASRLANQSR